jgi:hypothetical protein
LAVVRRGTQKKKKKERIMRREKEKIERLVRRGIEKRG